MKLVAVADPSKIESVPSTAGRVTKLADQLNVAFLVYRSLMSDELKKKDAPVESSKAAKAVLEAEDRIKIYWSNAFSPNIKSGLKIHGLDEDTAQIMAGKYAGKMAETINEVSDRAFIEGYNAALNKNWDRAVAWKRIADAYGLDPVQMRKWVMYYPEDGYHPDEIPQQSKDLLDTLLGERGKRIGDNEAWTVKNMGKQASWEKKIRSGKLPTGTKKVWRTAQDELVCDVCGPLDGTVVSIENEYDVSDGSSFFVPPLHVNCRCDIELEKFEIVTKFDKFKRDKNGRFSSVESRGAKSAKSLAELRANTPTLHRSSSITRSGKSQPTSTNQSSLAVAGVKRQQEPKVPYKSEFIVSTPPKSSTPAATKQKVKGPKSNKFKPEKFKPEHFVSDEFSYKTRFEIKPDKSKKVFDDAKKSDKASPTDKKSQQWEKLDHSYSISGTALHYMLAQDGIDNIKTAGGTVDLSSLSADTLAQSDWHVDMIDAVANEHETFNFDADSDEDKMKSMSSQQMREHEMEYDGGLTGGNVNIALIPAGTPVKRDDKGNIVAFGNKFEAEQFIAEPNSAYKIEGEPKHSFSRQESGGYLENPDAVAEFDYYMLDDEINETDAVFTMTLLTPVATED